jgi:hypothetical protein
VRAGEPPWLTRVNASSAPRACVSVQPARAMLERQSLVSLKVTIPTTRRQQMMRRSRVWLLSAVALLAVAACEDDDPVAPEPARNFTVTMTGLKERPNPVSPAGNGTATFTLDDAETTLSYTVSVASMTSTITAAHIHLGNANVAGQIIVALTTPINGQTVTGTITTQSTLGLGLTFPSLIALMRNGDAYVNVHTSNNTGGEIRGQVEIAP